MSQTKSTSVITRQVLGQILRDVDSRFSGDGCLYLIGESSQVAEGWRDWTTQVEFYASVEPTRKADFLGVVDDVVRATGYDVIHEFPGDLIPLPYGYLDRSPSLSSSEGLAEMRLDVRHFDPYSVVFRFVARGDEPDYHIALMYLDKGWITFDEMDQRLEDLLPEFSLETIAQDPAEFRRKYRGLRQMWRKQLRPRMIHRPTET